MIRFNGVSKILIGTFSSMTLSDVERQIISKACNSISFTFYYKGNTELSKLMSKMNKKKTMNIKNNVLKRKSAEII